LASIRRQILLTNQHSFSARTRQRAGSIGNPALAY